MMENVQHLKMMLSSMMVIIMLGLGAPAAALAADDKLMTAKPQTPLPVAQPVNPGVNTITQVAVKAGVLACTSRINQVANFLTVGSQGVGVFLFVPPVDPDRRLVSVSMEIPAAANVPAAYVSASFAPNQTNGCGGLYESVIYWSQTCDEVAARNFSGLKKSGTLVKALTVMDGGISTKIFLMPAGSGCVSIKKEVLL